MALIDDVLKAGPVPFLGLGIAALALPYFFPALRPQFAAVAKSGAKLFLEAELGADDAIADRFVGAAVDALFQATAHGTDEERKQQAEKQVDRFVSRAHAGARRRCGNWTTHSSARVIAPIPASAPRSYMHRNRSRGMVPSRSYRAHKDWSSGMRLHSARAAPIKRRAMVALREIYERASAAGHR
jgi:hypothetical protein